MTVRNGSSCCGSLILRVELLEACLMFRRKGFVRVTLVLIIVVFSGMMLWLVWKGGVVLFDTLYDGVVTLPIGLKFIIFGSIEFGVCCSVLIVWMRSVNGVVVVC